MASLMDHAGTHWDVWGTGKKLTLHGNLKKNIYKKIKIGLSNEERL